MIELELRRMGRKAERMRIHSAVNPPEYYQRANGETFRRVGERGYADGRPMKTDDGAYVYRFQSRVNVLY